MKKSIGILLLGMLYAAIFSCSEKGGGNPLTGNGIELSLDDAWISNMNDIDGDGYYSSASISWEITSDGTIDLVAYISYRTSTSSGSYSSYKSGSFSISEGSSIWFLPLGDSGYELTNGCYDFLIEIYEAGDTETLLLSVSATDDPSLNDFCMETPAEEFVLALSVSDAWINNTNDPDGDGYNSAGRINWSIVTNSAINVVFRLSIRDAASSGSYTEYKVSSTFSTTSQDWFWGIGDAGYELANGGYDFLIEVLDANNQSTVLGLISADQDADINDVTMELPSQEMWEIILNNTTYTTMEITVGAFGTQSVLPGGNYYYTANSDPGTITVSASTSGTFSNGGVIGIELFWNFNITPGAYYETDLVVNSDYFMLYYRNNSGGDLSGVYVNYGTNDQTFDNVFLPSDNVNYRIGYYRALTGNEIRTYFADQSGAYWFSIEGTHYFYGDPDSDGNNYIVEIYLAPATQNMSQGFDEHWNKSKIQLGQMLQPAAKINTVNRKYINPHYGTSK